VTLGRFGSALAVVALSAGALGCTSKGDPITLGRFRITITAVNGADAPTDFNALPSLPANLGSPEDEWDFTVEALTADGAPDPSFNGVARVSVVPGAVQRVLGPSGLGRNLQILNGQATASAAVIAAFGPARLWLEDIGYVPAQPGQVPLCSDGVDNDGDVVNDFPNDPGCAFADDMTEEPGTLDTGVSQVVRHELPTVADVNGRGAETPFPSVALQIRTNEPSNVIVTRVASAGFFVTDIGDPDHPLGYNHLFAFNFNTPPNLRVCDRLDYLTGTASEFFGFTEVSFPSYEAGLWDDQGADCRGNRLGGPVPDGANADQYCRDNALGDFCRRGRCQPCPMPTPVEIDDMLLGDDAEMEKLESGLVRMSQLRIAANFGRNPPKVMCADPMAGSVEIDPVAPCAGAVSYQFAGDASNCDFTGDGAIDFFDDREGGCSNACSADPTCTDWVGFSSRGNFKVSRGGVMLQVNTGTATSDGFDPRDFKGQSFIWVTGSLRNFSGGSLNWTIETRCLDDLICNFQDISGNYVCAKGADGVALNMPSADATACSSPPTEDDNDAGSN
jgi:hypothetical protein